MTDEQKERVRKWVAALRSGEYKQGQEALVIKDEPPRYCCIGVGGCVSELVLHEDAYEELQDYYGYDARFESELIGANDTRGLSFPEIADIIEARFLKQENAPLQ